MPKSMGRLPRQSRMELLLWFVIHQKEWVSWFHSKRSPHRIPVACQPSAGEKPISVQALIRPEPRKTPSLCLPDFLRLCFPSHAPHGVAVPLWWSGNCTINRQKYLLSLPKTRSELRSPAFQCDHDTLSPPSDRRGRRAVVLHR